jgi:hypothetical protein
VQPEIAAAFFSDPLLIAQGLMSRYLLSAPTSAMGTRLWREPPPEAAGAMRCYSARILDILESPLPTNERGELEPRAVPLSQESRQIWVRFADHVERLISPDGALSPVSGLANKLAEHAARIAAVLATVETGVGLGEVPAWAMAAGIEIAQHHAEEALRLFRVGDVPRDLRQAQDLLDWLHWRWGKPQVGLRHIYRLGPNAIRDARRARRLAEVLEDHGWLVRIEPGADVAIEVDTAGATVATEWCRDAWDVIGVEGGP